LNLVCLPAAAAAALLMHVGQLSKLIQAGKLKPTIAKVFPLSEAAAAHELLETGHVRGKMVLSVAEL
jgi:NADPH:quinone reductase-like Zn-dependent oxidoreductase